MQWCKDVMGLDWTVTPAPPPPGAATTLPPIQVATFDVDVVVEDATAFNEQAYVDEMAKAAGVNAADVSVKKTEYVVETVYSFSANEVIEEASLKSAIAKDWGVPETAVTLKIETVRRLTGLPQPIFPVPAPLRQLWASTQKVTATLKTEDATTANSVKTKSAEPAGIIANLAADAGVTAAATVVEQPKTEVKVTTEVKSETVVDTTAVANSADTIATAAGGTGATLDTSSVTKTEVANTTPPGENVDAASTSLPMVALALIVFKAVSAMCQ
jgi:hypothetical protein